MIVTTTAKPGAAEIEIDQLGRVTTRRRLGMALIAAGLAMMPWLVVLAATLPATARAVHWSAAWVGLDASEGCALLATGVLLIRQDARCSLTAAVTATLVLTDAWFDVLTSQPGAAQIMALVLATCVEIPVTVLCATLALRTFPRPGRSGRAVLRGHPPRR